MRMIAFLLLVASLNSGAAPRPDYALAPVPFSKVKVEDDFWSPRIDTNRLVTIWYNFKKCEETGRIDNFAKAGRLMEGPFKGTPFDDSDVYKVIEGAARVLVTHPDKKLDRYLDELIRKIAAAQEPDGYLYTARTIDPKCRVDFFGPTRWSNLAVSHELYNVGHLYEAAVAHFLATGKRTLLDVALRNADLVCSVFGRDEKQLKEPPGHQEIEIGLVKLFRVTGKEKYLKQAEFFCDLRGRQDTHKLRGPYQQDHKPIVEQDEAVGHAVRAAYYYAGVADVAALTGNTRWTQALDKLWENVVTKKMHLTGGIGARADGEAFGANYELPNDSAYLETCAAIANALWNHRMYLLHGDPKYMDVFERILYNGFLSGVSISGDRFFYPNPLETDGLAKFNHGHNERAPWFGCSCCPPNDARFISELGGYFYAVQDANVFVNLFAGSTVEMSVGGKSVTLRQKTTYPWNGKVRIEVVPKQPLQFVLNIRVPGWAASRPVPGDLYTYAAADDTGAKVNLRTSAQTSTPGNAPKGYISLQRRWRAGDFVEVEFPMPVRKVLCNDAVKANVGRFAIERGPLVYCAEGADNQGSVLSKFLQGGVSFSTQHKTELLGGVTTIAAKSENGQTLNCIPYYAWCHRGPNEMRVWQPTSPVMKLASHCHPMDSVQACFDAAEPSSSGDSSIPRFTWWDHKGTGEWVIQKFAEPTSVRQSSVYWFDDTGAGSCRTPASWRLLYLKDGVWVPVESSSAFGVAKDAYNTVEFTPVTTTALKMDVQLQESFSGGILEWKSR